jgi:hypothetical protein
LREQQGSVEDTDRQDQSCAQATEQTARVDVVGLASGQTDRVKSDHFAGKVKSQDLRITICVADAGLYRARPDDVKRAKTLSLQMSFPNVGFPARPIGTVHSVSVTFPERLQSFTRHLQWALFC